MHIRFCSRIGEATISNLKLLLSAERGSLFGDPYFGTLLKRVIYEQNDQILRDLIIDEIYTSIITFMPQIYIKRTDIEITSDGVTVFASLKFTSLMDGQPDLYTIKLTSDYEE